MKQIFQETLERYLRERGEALRATTARHHRLCVARFLTFIETQYPHVDSLEQIRRPHVERWLRAIKRRQPPYSAARKYRIIGPVRRFLDDLHAWSWPRGPRRALLRREDLPEHRRDRRRRATPSAPRQREFPVPGNPFHDALKRYLDVRSATLRPGTVENYQIQVLSLIEYIRERFPEIDSFANLQRPHLEAWLGMLASRRPPYKNSTRSGYIRDVRRFLEDIHEWGWSQSPPPGLLLPRDFPPEQRYLPKPLAPDVDRRLMKALKRRGDLVSLGLILARKTGVRVGELCRLQLNCLTDAANGLPSIRVPLGKLRSEREIPIDQETVDLIELIRRRKKRPPTIDPESGRSIDLLLCYQNGTMIRRSLFVRRIKSVGKECGITENLYPHRLRHTYATELLRNGLSLPAIMKLLGHRTLKMTLRYVEVTNDDLGREYLNALEKARTKYAELHGALNRETADDSDSAATIKATFEQLVARIQAIRFEHTDEAGRKKLQRFVERLRRAQRDLPDLLP